MRVYLRTFGCRANHYDSEAARAMIERAGHHLTSDVGDADVAVFNSCAVTAEAEADVRSAVRRAARARPGLRSRSEEHTSELQSHVNLVCRLLLEKKKN